MGGSPVEFRTPGRSVVPDRKSTEAQRPFIRSKKKRSAPADRLEYNAAVPSYRDYTGGPPWYVKLDHCRSRPRHVKIRCMLMTSFSRPWRMDYIRSLQNQGRRLLPLRRR